MMQIFAIAVFSYLLGSVPFGLLFAKLLGKDDLRTKGSGNIGATNAMRVGGKLLGGLTFAFDFLKGIAAVAIARYLTEDQATLCLSALFAVLGHIFPVWLKFKGGKGVATSVAVIFAINYLLGLFAIFCWILVFGFSRISSLASLATATITLLVSLFANYSYEQTALIFALFLLIVVRHKDNIIRLKNRTEKL